MDPDFTIVMRGYERQEVDAYIRDLVAETTRLGERVAELESQLERARSSDDGSEGSKEAGFRQLGEETTRILVAAETAAREMREKAERDAASTVEAAEQSARQQVEAASENAERIVAEAEARRREIEAEIGRLDDVRASMVDNLRAAIRSAEQGVEQLPAATETAGDGAAAAAVPAQTAVAKGDGESAPEDPDRAATTPDVRIVDPSVADEPDAEAAVPPADVEEDEDGDTQETADEAQDAAIAPEEELAAEAALAGEAVTTEEVSDDAVAQDAGPAEEDEPATAVEAADEAEEDAPVDAPQGADQGAVAAALADADEAAGRIDQEPQAGESDASMLRERSLAGVRPGMLRRLRRGLQEVQNRVLESVRTRDEDAGAEDLLPADEEVDGLHDVARLFLDAGYRAGRTDAPVLTGGAPLQDPPTDTELVATTAELLAAELLDELRTTLAPSLRAGLEADEPGASLSERVGEVFRDLKGPVVETVVDQHLTAIYGRATLAAWAEDDVAEVRWLLDEETRCPEGMCRANAAEGPVPTGKEFPSGNDVPPAHEGCTCALSPA